MASTNTIHPSTRNQFAKLAALVYRVASQALPAGQVMHPVIVTLNGATNEVNLVDISGYLKDIPSAAKLPVFIDFTLDKATVTSLAIVKEAWVAVTPEGGGPEVKREVVSCELRNHEAQTTINFFIEEQGGQRYLNPAPINWDTVEFTEPVRAATSDGPVMQFIDPNPQFEPKKD